jgi:3-dehydroquinate synthase
MKLVTKTGESEFFVGRSIDDLLSLCGSRKAVAVIDQNVRRIYGERLKDFEFIEIGEGENSKTLLTVEKIYERFLEIGVDKSHIVIGIGGGVVCDIAGYAASTFMRGIPFGFVPTTLLAQVDASIGGKNGVNLKGYKNLIGTIRQPEFCLIDLNFLKTLPKSELMSGLAEIVKAGAIADLSLFEYIEKNYLSILSMNKEEINKAVSSAISIKIGIVSSDEMEQWERMKLNFGHTIGHAIEKVAKIPHGYAVSIGMIAAGKLSVSKGLLDNSQLKRITDLLQKVGLPIKIKANKNDVMEAITKDKKRRSSKINMVLLDGIGNAVINAVEEEDISNILDGICL